MCKKAFLLNVVFFLCFFVFLATYLNAFIQHGVMQPHRLLSNSEKLQDDIRGLALVAYNLSYDLKSH